MSNLPLKSPKHRIEFTGNAAPKRRPIVRRKPPPRWLIGWLGGLLLWSVGAALGGCGTVALIWKMMSVTDDVGSPIGAIVTLFLGAIVGATAGSVVGLFVWAMLSKGVHEPDE